MHRKIDHLAIAVKSLDDALRFYERAFGLRENAIVEIADQKTRVAFISMGECRLELLEPMGDDSPVGRFLKRRGEGLHHVCFRVDDIEAEISRLRTAGVKLIDDVPRRGAEGCLVAFIHPSSSAGVLIELSQSAGHPTNPISG